MLRLQFPERYKSIPAQGEISLPAFVILVGANGSGKTQFLEAISNGSAHVSINEKNDPVIKYLDIKAFLSKSDGQGQMTDFYGICTNINQHIQTNINTDDWDKLDTNKKRRRAIKSNTKNPFLEIICPIVIDRIGFDKSKINISSIMNVISSSEIEAAENDDILIDSISRLFYNYFILYDQNRYQRYLSEQSEYDHDILTDEEFYGKHGNPPWDVINQFLTHTGLGLSVDQPKNREDQYRMRISVPSGEEIVFDDLSSGEQVLLQVAGAVLKSENKLSFPDLVLLDEPDAALHPSMAKLLIESLNNSFVRKHGIHMIVTTHTPTTVAVCDEPAIFMMDGHERRPEKVNRDKALSNLISGLPTVNLYVSDQRTVFVESKYDAEFLQLIFNSWKPEHVLISLHFLSSGSQLHSGSCETVYEMVDNLNAAGAPHIYGVVDYDNVNKPKGNVFVISGGERYSIEQFILDPIFVSILLIRDRHHDSSDFGLPEKIDDFRFKDMSSEMLQSVVDATLRIMKDNVSANGKCNDISSDFINENLDKVLIRTVDGRSYRTERWFLIANGHDIENLLLKSFPKLNQYKKNSDHKLKAKMIDLVITRYIGLISQSLIDTFEEILKKD